MQSHQAAQALLQHPSQGRQALSLFAYRHARGFPARGAGSPRAEGSREIFWPLSIDGYDKKEFGLSDNKKLVLIVMGSLGSKTINDKMKNMLTLFNNKDYEVMFVTGKNYFDEYKKNKYTKNIKLVPYIDGMTSLLKKTDCIVSRAGASTLAEISALNVPSILIPSPYVTENHQYKNAMDLVNSNAALILEEKDLEGDTLLRMVEKVLNDKVYTNNIKRNLKSFEVKNSASLIYDKVVKLVGDKK